MPVARKEARKRKSRFADAQEKEVHEDVIVTMSLELRASMDTMTTERLPRHLAATAAIAKYRALYDGIDRPKWTTKYTPGHLKKWANNSPGKRPSAIRLQELFCRERRDEKISKLPQLDRSWQPKTKTFRTLPPLKNAFYTDLGPRIMTAHAHVPPPSANGCRLKSAGTLRARNRFLRSEIV